MQYLLPGVAAQGKSGVASLRMEIFADPYRVGRWAEKYPLSTHCGNV